MADAFKNISLLTQKFSPLHLPVHFSTSRVEMHSAVPRVQYALFAQRFLKCHSLYSSADLVVVLRLPQHFIGSLLLLNAASSFTSHDAPLGFDLLRSSYHIFADLHLLTLTLLSIV